MKEAKQTKVEPGKRTVPANAMRLGVGQFRLAEGADAAAESAPIHLSALSGDPIESWYWGPCVHDLKGMKVPRPRIAVDYCHDPAEIIGYVDRWATDGGSLELDGALVPYGNDDMAGKVIAKARGGVPYEASIDFTPSMAGDLDVEFVPEMASVEVNGRTVQGPITVFRGWVLRGVAVCPHGADRVTDSTVQSGGPSVEVEIRAMAGQEKQPEPQKEQTMSEEQKPATTQAAQPAEAAVPDTTEQTPATMQAAEQAAVEAKPVEAQPEPAPQPVDPRAEFKAFVEAFGMPEGAAYYGEGLTWEEAKARHEQSVKDSLAKVIAENEQLKAQLAARQPQAAPFDPAGDADTGDIRAQLARIKDPREKAAFFKEHFGKGSKQTKG